MPEAAKLIFIVEQIFLLMGRSGYFIMHPRGEGGGQKAEKKISCLPYNMIFISSPTPPDRKYEEAALEPDKGPSHGPLGFPCEKS